MKFYQSRQRRELITDILEKNNFQPTETLIKNVMAADKLDWKIYGSYAQYGGTYGLIYKLYHTSQHPEEWTLSENKLEEKYFKAASKAVEEMERQKNPEMERKPGIYDFKQEQRLFEKDSDSLEKSAEKQLQKMQVDYRYNEAGSLEADFSRDGTYEKIYFEEENQQGKMEIVNKELAVTSIDADLRYYEEFPDWTESYKRLSQELERLTEVTGKVAYVEDVVSWNLDAMEAGEAKTLAGSIKASYQQAQKESTHIKDNIVKDLRRNGIQPTKQLMENMMDLNSLRGKCHTLQDVHDLYQNLYENNESMEDSGVKDCVEKIAEECRVQELEAIQPVMES